MLSPDYSKRDYLLSEGCKDLIDVIRLEQRKEQVWQVKKLQLGLSANTLLPRDIEEIAKKKGLGDFPGVPPPISGTIEVSGPVTVKKVAELVGEKPFKIIADLMQIGVFATLNQVLNFEAIEKVARKYGYKV